MASRGKGSRWAPEWKTFQDPVSGARVRQLTTYKGHSSHFYFTNPCWYDNLQKMLLVSDRENCTNLFSIDLESGTVDLSIRSGCTSIRALALMGNTWSIPPIRRDTAKSLPWMCPSSTHCLTEAASSIFVLVCLVSGGRAHLPGPPPNSVKAPAFFTSFRSCAII
jgi:hypothetical protein